jgi:hypothetical protein
MECEITFEINGKIVHRQKMRSFIKNFLDEMTPAMSINTGATMVAEDGNSCSPGYRPLNPGMAGYLSSYFPSTYPTAGQDATGIVVGTGNAAVTLTDYKLATKILTGSTSGKLAYQAQGVGVTSVVGQVTTTRFTRSFINSSGGSIIVSEVGMQGFCYDNYYLMCRDVVTSPVTVINGDTLNVYMDWKVTA